MFKPPKTAEEILALFYPKSIVFIPTEKEGLYLPMDEDGFYYTKERLQMFLKEIMKVYDTFSDKEIQEYNNFKAANYIKQQETKSASSEEEPVRRQRPGYVYLIKASNGMFKVGQSINPKKRLKGLESAVPLNLKLIHTIKTNDMDWLEESLHCKFQKAREKGEWFALKERHVSFMKKLGPEFNYTPDLGYGPLP